MIKRYKTQTVFITEVRYSNQDRYRWDLFLITNTEGLAKGTLQKLHDKPLKWFTPTNGGYYNEQRAYGSRWHQENRVITEILRIRPYTMYIRDDENATA